MPQAANDRRIMRDTVQPIRAAPYFSFSADGGFLRVSPSVSMLFFRRDLKHAMPKKGASIETCFSPFPALALSKTSVPPVSRPTGSEGQFFSGRRICGEQKKMPQINSIPICVGQGQALRKKYGVKQRRKF